MLVTKPAAGFGVCCSGAELHVVALVVVLSELALLTVAMIVLSIYYTHEQNHPNSQQRHSGVCYFVGSLVAIPVFAAAGAIMVWGIAKRRPFWILPHICIQTLFVVLVTGTTANMLFGTPFSGICDTKETNVWKLWSLSSLSWATIGCFFAVGIVHSYYLLLVIRCYRHVRRIVSAYTRGALIEITENQDLDLETATYFL